MADPILFALGLITVVAAIGVVASREAVHSALCLTLHLLGIGGLYLALHHQFLAVAQMLVYAGAVMVVFMFAVTTLSPQEEPLKLLSKDGLPLLGVLTGGVAFACLYRGIATSLGTQRVAAGGDKMLEASSFAADLFGPFLLPFEGTAFLLLTALIGAMILGGRRQIGDG